MLGRKPSANREQGRQHEESLKALLHCGLTKNKLLRIEVEDLSKKAWQKLNSEDNKQ